MSKAKKTAFAVFALLCALCLCFGLASCGGKDIEPTYGYGEEGTYYSDTSEGEYLLTLRSGTFVLSLEDGTGTSGTYEYSEGILFMTYYGDEEATECSYSEGVIRLTWSGQTVTFLRREYYTVTFSDGGTTLSTQSVLNGKAAQDPGDASKEGYVFLGWYTDSAFTERYEFNTAITGNTTIYARFVESSGAAEYKITFDYTGETTETINGIVYNLPEPEKEGYTFLGWWVSATNNADELTYKYEGETLCEDTTLFAVFASGSYIGASVKDGTLYWENSPASQMTVTVTDEGGATYSYDTQTTNQSFSIAALSATGTYSVTVSCGGVTENLVYISNGLSRVSGFTVISGSILMYGAVANAERYYITIECGTEGHNHTYIDNGTSLYYDFSSCEMPAEGITFMVYAEANGYVTSVSSPFNYFLGLDRVTVTVENGEVTWERVSLAQEYEVYIDGALVATTSDTSYSLSNYGTGTYEISVRPVTTGYYSEMSEAISFTKTTLASPEISGIADYTISWTPIEGATGYIVSINGIETTISGGDITSLILSDENYTEGLDSYEISVKAMAEDSANDSPYGESIIVTGASVGSAVSYNNGTVTWQYSLSASEYRITVNDGDELIVAGTNSSPITLTKSGNNEITIYFVDEDGDIYGTAEITVYAYAIVFDARGGTAYMNGEVIDTIYVAKGDIVTLPDADYTSGAADFIGWYTLPDTEIDPDKEAYAGDGTLFEDGTVFTGNSTIVLYAFWINQRLTITLDPGLGTLTDADGNAIDSTLIPINGSRYTIAVPEYDDGAYVFLGWYSGENGTGKRYTYEDGSASTTFSDTRTMTLYAYWAKIFTFSTTTYSGETVLSVEKGADINDVTEATIPETYTINGVEYPVKYIGNSAFASCPNLEILNIPDTVTYINITNNGYSSGSGAFASSANIKEVNVYATGEPSTTREIIYYSNGGALFDKNSISGNIELVYYPYGRTEEVYTVPSTVCNENEYELQGLSEVPVVHDVTEIWSYVFGMRYSLKKVIFPETVTTLDSCIFYNTSNLESVEFEGEITSIPDDMFYGCSSFTGIDIPDSVTEIGNRAFYACTSLTEIYMPDSVTTLGTNIFYNCYALESVRLSESITEIGNYDFYNCQSLKGIEIPYGVTTIGERAFYGCYVLARAYLPASLTTINSYAFYWCYMLSDVVLPQSLTTINSSAFYGCYSLTTITIPSSVTTIGNYAFQNCFRLLEVCNESSFEFTIGSASNGYVAYYAKNLYTPGNGETHISTSDGFSFIYDENGDYVLFDYDNSSPTAVLPDDVDGNPYDVYQYSFYGCDRLVSLTIPSSITSIGSYAFYNCTALEEIYFDANVPDFGSSNYIFYNAGIDGDGIDVTIGKDVTAVPSYMFYPRNASDGMPNVGSLTFEEGSVCETIGTDAFYGAVGIKSISLPDSVKKIGDYAFYGCEGLTYADLGAGIEEIGNYAFYNCYALEEVSWGDELRSIGTAAFRNCASLEEVVIPGNVETIDAYCFYDCTSLTSVTLPASVKSVGDYAFDGCVRLVSVTMEEGLEKLGDYCFYGCSSLAAITLPSGITSIGNDAFVGTAYYDDEDNWEGDALYMNTYLIRVRDTADGSYVVKDGTTILAGYAFSGCGLLTKITLPESLTSIGKYAFYNCKALSDVNIPGGVTLIEQYAFDNCTSLAAITLPAGITEISDGLFYYCTALKDLMIPEGVTQIGGYAFYYCQSLVAMTIPDAVTSIGTYAFYGCSAMVELTIGAGVRTISTYAFNQTTGLERIYYNATEADALASYNGTFYNSGRSGGGLTVYVGKGVTEIPAYLFYPNSSVSYAPKITSVVFEDGSVCEEIGDYAFDLCASLVAINIPDSVTRIGASAFYACYSLTNVTIPSGVTEIGSSAFYNCYKLVEVYNESTLSITAGSSSNGYVAYYALNVYTPDEGESHMFDRDGYVFAYDDSGNYYFMGYTGEGGDLVLPDYADGHTYEIYDYAFYYSATVTSIVIPDSVTAIGERAFYYCDTITSVTIGNGVTSIPDYTFYYASNLKEVTLGSGITSIGGYAFYWCNRLQGIDLPDGVTEVGQYAFYYCYGMEYATLGSSLTSIGTYGFYNCSGLKSITFPEGLLTIGDRAFRDCSGLREINFCSTITTLGQYAFYGCNSVRNVEIPSSLTSIGNYAFQNCYQLSYATIPDGVTTIPTSCFQNCYSLRKVTIGKDVSTISSNAFYNCYSLVEILNMSALTITAGDSSYGYVGYYAVNVYTPTSGSSILFDEGDYTFFLDGDEYFLIGYSGDETDLVLPDAVNGGVYGIYGYAFYGMADITSVRMPDGVTGLGDYAFASCTALVSVNIPGGVINEYAFQNDTALRRAEICEGVTYIDRYAFSGCSQLEAIAIPSTVTYIGNYCFSNCSAATSLTLPEGLLTIDSNAFYNCKGITSVTLPDSLTTMGSGAFSGCSGIEEAVVGRGLTALPSNAFYNCSSLRTVTIGRAVTTIGTNVFYNCYLLEEIRYNATTVMDLSTYNYAFQNAGRDTDGITLYIASNVLYIPAYLFNPNSSESNAPKITAVIFEEGTLLQGIGEGAFRCCTQIESVFFSDSEATWKLVDIGEDNDGLLSARTYFYSASKKSGCWHYGDDGEIELW